MDQQQLYLAVIRAKSANKKMRDRGFRDLDEITRGYRIFIRKQFRMMDLDDIIACFDDGLMAAVKNYDPCLGSFESLLHMSVRNRLINISKRCRPTSLQESYVTCSRRHDLMAELPDLTANEAGDVCETDYFEHHGILALSKLTDLELGSISLFLQVHTYEEIATTLGRSQKTIDNALKRARWKLAAYGRHVLRTAERAVGHSSSRQPFLGSC